MSQESSLTQSGHSVRQALTPYSVETKLKALAVNRGVVTPEEFKHVIESEIIKYKGVIKAADLHFT